MFNKKYLALFLSTVACTILLANSAAPIFGLQKAIAKDTIETVSLSPKSSHQSDNLSHHQEDLIAQFGFGLPDILNGGVPDIPGAIDRKIDQVESSIRSRIPNVLQPLLPENLFSLENVRLSEFADYFGRDVPEFEQQPEDISKILGEVATETGHRHAMIYISYQKDAIEGEERDGLEFLLFAPDTPPQILYAPGYTQEQLDGLVQQLRQDLALSLRRNTKEYLETGRTLYQALITPIEEYLKSNKIDGLIFSMDQGLRSLPLAALHDGDRYLIEKYSLAVVPSFFNINSEYDPLKAAPVLAMGAESFKDLDPLPGAGLEVSAIAKITTGEGLLNEQFTVDNLKNARTSQNFPIVHLATHAEFNSGSPKKSHIYLWNDRIELNDIRKLNLDNPPVDLFVLSACQTALGSREAELGFAGLTIASGAKTALGSLWSVSDAGTLVLMQNFYNYLQTETTKSAALRQAQLEMLKGNLRVVGGQVRRTSGAIANIQLTEDLQTLNFTELTHPYYWSGFTLVGQPW